jgi:outer membrane protein assembly factor BamB
MSFCTLHGLPDHPNSKVNKAVVEVERIWRETAGGRSTQLVFCDLSIPTSGKGFSVYDDMRHKLIARGVPVIGSGLLFASAANRTGGQMDRCQGIRWEQLLQLDRNGDKKIQRSEIPEDYLWIMRPDYPTNNPGYAAGSLLSRFDRIDTDKDGALSEAEWDAYATQWGLRFCPGLKAIRPGNNGDLTESHVAWQLHRGIPEIPSPLFYRNRLYLIRDGGVLQCVRPETGKMVYEERLGAPGAYCASPIAANGLIYFASPKGTIIVIDGDSDSLRVLGRNALGEKIWATPAPVQDALYVRTEQHLFSFSTAAPLSVHSQGDGKR